MTAPPVRVALPMLLALAACAPSGHPAGPSPRAGAHESATAVRLPPVPLIIGPLKISVVYPAATDIVELRDSAFLFGSTGNGRAAVSVNGQAARVWPNGAWIAWIAVPDDTLLNFTIEARETPKVRDWTTQFVGRGGSTHPSPRFGSTRPR